jgi:hypothetical protein
MKIFPAALTGLLLVLPALAGAQDVKIDYDKAFNFSPVKTYSIKIGTTWGNDLSQRRVLTEFDEAIAAKGWKKVAEGQADVQVILHGATQTKRTANTFYSGLHRRERVQSRRARRGHVRLENQEPRVPWHRR